MENVNIIINELNSFPSLSNKIIFKELFNYIVYLKDKKELSLMQIHQILKEKLPKYNGTYDAFRKYYNEYIKNEKGEKMEINEEFENQKVKKIAIVNFKGGVGKSTIANLLDLNNKVIINLDIAQDAQKINSDETYNFYSLKEEYGIDNIEEAIQGAIEGGKKNIILDTPGEIEQFIESLPLIDYFIVPFTPADRSIEATITTIETINEILNDMKEKRNDKWCLVINRFLNDNDLNEFKNVYDKAKKILKDKLICKTNLKNSQVIPSMERKKMSLKDLIKENPIAYGVFKKRVTELNTNIKKFLGEENV